MHWSNFKRGNLTLVQAMTLMPNYAQEINKANSGHNHLGVALGIAMGIILLKKNSQDGKFSHRR